MTGLDGKAAVIVARALEHWGLSATVRENRTGNSPTEVKVEGVKIDGEPVSLYLTVEAIR